MRVAVLSSGGKDSAAAWWWALCQGWTIDSLVTVRVLGDDSPMFQLPSTHLVERQQFFLLKVAKELPNVEDVPSRLTVYDISEGFYLTWMDNGEDFGDHFIDGAGMEVF